MYRAMAGGERILESACALEFEEPAFATLGLCYEKNGRFSGGAYQPILRRVDGWLDEPLKSALQTREARAARLETLDGHVGAAVKALQEKGFKSPYLRAFVVARVNPLRFMKTVPPFDEALDDIVKRAARFNAGNVKQEDVASAAGPVDAE
jgi:ParB family chromosome partitioning protein